MKKISDPPTSGLGREDTTSIFHNLRVFIITAFGLVLCGTAWAGEAEVRSKGKEIEQVRDLIYKEIAGHIKGDPDQIMSCYADAPGTALFWAACPTNLSCAFPVMPLCLKPTGVSSATDGRGVSSASARRGRRAAG